MYNVPALPFCNLVLSPQRGLPGILAAPHSLLLSISLFCWISIRALFTMCYAVLLGRFSCVQLFETLCPVSSSSVHGNLQRRILEWVAIPFSRESSQPRDWTDISCDPCIAGRFFTAEPLGKPFSLCKMSYLFVCFLLSLS